MCFKKELSGSNKTNKSRRVLLIQYSAEPILKSTGEPLYWAEPFIKEGKNISARTV